jgi:hypothetical protein
MAKEKIFMSNLSGYDPLQEKSKLEFEMSQSIRNLFCVESMEELGELAASSIGSSKNRVLNLASAIGVPDGILEHEETLTHSLVLPSEDIETHQRLALDSVKSKNHEHIKIKPSLLLVRQVYKGVEYAYNSGVGIVEGADYDRIKSETLGYLTRFGVGVRIIKLLEQNLPDGKNIFVKKDLNKVRYSFASFLAGRYVLADSVKVFSFEAINDVQSEFPAAMIHSTDSIRQHNPNRSVELGDSVTFGLTRPMNFYEALTTVRIFQQKAKPVLVR